MNYRFSALEAFLIIIVFNRTRKVLLFLKVDVKVTQYISSHVEIKLVLCHGLPEHVTPYARELMTRVTLACDPFKSHVLRPLAKPEFTPGLSLRSKQIYQHTYVKID